MDYSTIIVGVLALVGTLTGTMVGNSKTTALVTYRLKQLEEKVNKHNSVIERTYKLEERAEVQDEKLKVANNRIKDLEVICKEWDGVDRRKE